MRMGWRRRRGIERFCEEGWERYDRMGGARWDQRPDIVSHHTMNADAPKFAEIYIVSNPPQSPRSWASPRETPNCIAPAI